jgi:hypothetical protein
MVVCDPTPIATTVLFEPGAVALTAGERAKLSGAIARASAFPLNYVFVEPEAGTEDGPEPERLSIGRRRGEYLRAALMRMGIPGAKIEVSLAGVKSAEGRGAGVGIFVFDAASLQRCINGR